MSKGTQVVCGKYVFINPYTYVKDACVEFDTKIRDVKTDEDLCNMEKPLVITHGLASTHTHLGLYPVRSTLGYGLRLDDWVNTFAWPWERFLLKNPDASYATALVAIAEMLSSGITLFADMHFNEERVLDAVLRTGIKADLSVAVMNGGVFQSFDDALEANRELVNRVRKLGRPELVRARFGPCTPRLLNPSEFAEVVSAARREGVGVHAHIAEVPEDEEYLRKRWGFSLRDFIEYTGLGDNVDTLVAHAIWVQSLIDILAERGIKVSHAPRSNTLLRDGLAPITILLDAGVNVSLGIDVAPTYSVIDDAAFTIGLHYSGGDQALSAEDALWMASVAGYRALGFGTGELTRGEPADIVVWELTDVLPEGRVSHVVTNLVMGKAVVRKVIINGCEVYKGTSLTNVQPTELIRCKSRLANYLEAFLTS